MYPGHFAATTPDKAAIVVAHTGETITYAELDARANRVSRLLRDSGLAVGDHLAFMVGNVAEFLVLAWGAHYAGLYYTAVSTRLNATEVGYIVGNSGAKMFVASDAYSDVAAEVAKAEGADVARLMLGQAVEGFASYEEAVASMSEEPLADRVAGTDMLYSSGTTGRPKGVMKPLEGIRLEESQHPVGGLLTLLYGLTSDSSYLSPAPLYHAAPLRFTMGTHSVGATVIVMERFDAEDYLAQIERYSATHSQVVPTMFVRLVKLESDVRQAYDVSSLEMVVHAAAPCPIEVKEAIIDWWGPVVHEYYAGTEGNGFVCCDSAMWLAHKGTVGTPINCAIRIVDEDGQELPIGEVGSIYFEGGGAFEYHGDAAKTAESRHPKGWTTMGDIGRLDEDNFLYLTDRKAHMIITGGVNVYPQEAENLLTMHPQVFDVAVIGVPNEDFGEEVKAVVQLVDGVTASDELGAELVAYCRDRLADIKCPRSVDFRDELPRHATGKLYKRLLKDEYWAGHGDRRI